VLFYTSKFVLKIKIFLKNRMKFVEINNLIAKSKNGTEIIVSLIPLHKMQNTRQGSKKSK
jgi:hypothetical protein